MSQGSSWDALEPHWADRWIGRDLDGKYQILRPLGQGGMGSVFEAVQRSVDRRVAIKLLNPEYGRDPEAARRFQREAKAVAALRHPNTVVLHDFGETAEGVRYLVMEKVEGRVLNELLRRPMASERAVKIAIQLCRAASAAHQAGIVHRDLKPSNVLVSPVDDTEWIKVLDFGIAKILQGPSGEATQTGIIGTPRYMAPEQAAGTGAVGPAADLYAIGLILFEMLAGRPAFTDEAPMALVLAQIQRPPPRFAEIPHLQVDPALEALVQQALQKEPSRRFASAQAFGAALEGWLRSQPSVVQPLASQPLVVQPLESQPSVVQPSASSPRRRRFSPKTLWSAAAVTLTICAAILIGVLIQRRWPQRPTLAPAAALTSPKPAAPTPTTLPIANATVSVSPLPPPTGPEPKPKPEPEPAPRRPWWRKLEHRGLEPLLVQQFMADQRKALEFCGQRSTRVARVRLIPGERLGVTVRPEAPNLRACLEQRLDGRALGKDPTTIISFELVP